MKIDELRHNLESAMRHVDLLCKGFSVESIPSYRSILDKVCRQIETKTSWQQKTEPLFFIINRGVVESAVAFSSNNIMKQFKTKFIKIAKEEIVPELQRFCSRNPNIDIEDFRPLFDIQITMK